MRLKSSVGALVIALVSLAPAQASITPFLTGVSQDGSNFRFSYRADIDNEQTMNPATFPLDPALENFLTLFDIAGFADAVIVPAGFDFRVQTTGTTPAQTAPNDGPLPNLTIFRTGSALVGPQSFNFSFLSSIGSTARIDFAARGTLQEGGDGQSNIGRVLGPNAAAIPEASEIAMLASVGLFGLGYCKFRRRRASV